MSTLTFVTPCNLVEIYRNFVETPFPYTKQTGLRKKIQGVAGGKINIFGGDSISHCEKKSSYKYVSNSEWLPR